MARVSRHGAFDLVAPAASTGGALPCRKLPRFPWWISGRGVSSSQIGLSSMAATIAQAVLAAFHVVLAA